MAAECPLIVVIEISDLGLDGSPNNHCQRQLASCCMQIQTAAKDHSEWIVCSKQGVMKVCAWQDSVDSTTRCAIFRCQNDYQQQS
jgi:hypothetical protein